jgi:hypothetical protein
VSALGSARSKKPGGKTVSATITDASKVPGLPRDSDVDTRRDPTASGRGRAAGTGRGRRLHGGELKVTVLGSGGA